MTDQVIDGLKIGIYSAEQIASAAKAMTATSMTPTVIAMGTRAIESLTVLKIMMKQGQEVIEAENRSKNPT